MSRFLDNQQLEEELHVRMGSSEMQMDIVKSCCCRCSSAMAQSCQVRSRVIGGSHEKWCDFQPLCNDSSAKKLFKKHLFK